MENEEIIKSLKEQNSLLRRIATIRIKRWPKVLFFVNIFAFSAICFNHMLDFEAIKTMPPKANIIFIISLLAFGTMMASWHKMIWGEDEVIQCAVCKKLKSGKSWHDFPEFEKVHYVTCNDCATRIMPLVLAERIRNEK